MSKEDRLRKFRIIKENILKGSADGIENQKRSGKMTARERITSFFDKESFVEICAFLDNSPVGDFNIPGDGVVAGFGTVDGRPVYAYAQDFTKASGAFSEGNASKICRVYDMAQKNGAPVVAFLDSSGLRIEEGVRTLVGYGKVIKRAAALSGVVPQVAAVVGPCAGTASILTSLADLVVVVDNIGYMYVSGPQVVKAVSKTDEDIGSAVALAKSGAAHLTFLKESDCFCGIRKFLSYLPSNNLEDAPQYDCADEIYSEIPELNEIQGTYDIKLIIESIADNQDFMEIQPGFAKNALTGFVRINGFSVGIAANNPAVDGGALDVFACDKLARFVSFCDAFNIPIVSLTDTEGFMISTSQEKGGLAKAAARLASSFAEASVPKINLICGKAIGGAYVVMNSRALGADLAYAYPWAQISPVDSEAATVILFNDDIMSSNDPVVARKRAQEEYRNIYSSPFEAAKNGLIDDIIEPFATRNTMAYALDMQLSKRESKLPKKHSNLPL